MIFRALFFLFVLLPFMIVGMPIQALIIKLNLPGWKYIPRWFLRLSSIFFGLRVRVLGTPSQGKPTLMLSNHISWLDIVAIGGRVPVNFVAKSEISRWPMVSQLAALVRTIYVDRKKRSETGRTASAMGKHLAGGNGVVLFAEGQSDVGTHVLPFRSALVGAAQMAMAQAGALDVVLQPVTIAYTKMQGLPVGRNERSMIGWDKSKTVKQNVRQIFGGPVKDVTIAFGAAMPLTAESDRKAVTKAAEIQVRHNLVALNRGGQVRI